MLKFNNFSDTTESHGDKNVDDFPQRSKSPAELSEIHDLSEFPVPAFVENIGKKLTEKYGFLDMGGIK